MYNMKYTLTATPTESVNNWDLAIYGECERKVDETWRETPRESNLADKLMDSIIVQANDAEAMGVFQKTMFKGYNKSIPPNAKKVMEMSIVMSANKRTKIPTVKRGDFKRYEFGGCWNGCIHFLQELVDGMFANLRTIGKACDDPKVSKKIDEFCAKNNTDDKTISEMFVDGKFNMNFLKGL